MLEGKRVPDGAHVTVDATDGDVTGAAALLAMTYSKTDYVKARAGAAFPALAFSPSGMGTWK
jgi:hypothetical protein